MDPRRQLELVFARNERESAKSLRDYLNRVVIDCRPEPRPFGEVQEYWQALRNDRLVPALEYIAGYTKEYKGVLQFWEGWSKGQDKSSYCARILNGMLAFAPKKGLRFCCAAKDAEQAGVIKDCMVREASLNKWVEKRLDFRQKHVAGKENGSLLTILATDAAGAHGSSMDLTVMDELSHWGSEEMFDSLYAGAKKKEGYAGLIILTNAGYLNTWQDRIRGVAKERDGISWSFWEQPHGRPMASWITPKALEEAKLINSSSEFRRLFLNEWLSLTEDRGAFSESSIDAAIGNPLPVPPGGTAIISVDYGGVFDRTALCVMWFDGQKIHIPELKCWAGNPKDEIQISVVAEWVNKQIKKYPKRVIVFDPFQLLETAQRLEKEGEMVIRFNYKAGKNNTLMLQHLRTLLTNKKLVFSEECGYLNGETLASELKSVITKTMSYGERLDHEYNLHDDRTQAVGMGSLEAVKYPPIKPMSLGKQSSPDNSTSRLQQLGPFSSDHLNRRGLYGSN